MPRPLWRHPAHTLPALPPPFCVQLSVRKAALAAASRLVGAFPDQIACCELWVRAALPLVRWV